MTPSPARPPPLPPLPPLPPSHMPLPPLPLPPLDGPTASIVICNHNHGRFLAESLASALAQQPPCQVVVVDDGSTDGSRELLANADARVEVVLQASGGQLVAYTSGFARCRGEVVLFLDADDALYAGALAALCERFTAGVAKVHFRMGLVDAAGQALVGQVPSTLVEGDVFEPLRRRGVLYPSPPGSGNAYRRSVLERLFPLPLDPGDRVGADFFLVYGAAAFGRVAACPERLASYRLHRPAESAADAFVFGNAAVGNDEATKVGGRYARLRRWLSERTAGAVHLPERFVDFSVQKSSFASTVLASSRSWRGAGRALGSIVRAIWLQPASGVARRIGLTAWAIAVTTMPRPIGLRLARHVCNPAGRGGRAFARARSGSQAARSAPRKAA